MKRSPCAAFCSADRFEAGSAGTAAGAGTSGNGRPSGRWNCSAPVGSTLDLIAFFVHCAVVATAE